MQSEAFDRRDIPADARFTRWTAADGWVHRMLERRRAEGAPVRGSLLFAGGRGDFIEKYLEAHDHWLRSGWNVTAFDWRGQGGSQGDRPGGWIDRFETLVDDLAALIADWRAQAPGPHVVVAHSMGGHVLLRTLADRRPAIDAAVLVAPMLAINSAPVPPFAAEWLASFMSAVGWGRHPATPPAPGPIRKANLTGCADRYSDELWWWEKQPGFNIGPPSWAWLKAAYASSAALTPAKLKRVEVPVLLLGAERDRLVSAEAIRRAASLLPKAELEMYGDSAHEILREADPVRLKALARIDSFLDRHAAR